MLRGSLLDGLYGEVLVQHAAWLADEKLAKHLTLFIDGWSNARMESIYAICVMFPDRRAILLDALDLSSLTHSAENIAGALQTYLHAESVMPVKNVPMLAEIVVKIMNQYGPKKFTGIVTDNARSMVNMRTIVVNTFPHIIECRCCDSYQSTFLCVWHCACLKLCCYMQVHDALFLYMHGISDGTSLCHNNCQQGAVTCHILQSQS